MSLIHYQNADGANQTPVSAAAPLPVTLSAGTPANVAPDSVSEGTASTASVSSGATVLTFNTTGFGYIAFFFTSVGASNTVLVEGSNDGTVGTGSTFNPSELWNVSTVSAGDQRVTLSPATGTLYVAPVTAATMRIRVSSYVSGTVTVFATQKRGSAPAPTILSAQIGNNGNYANIAASATDAQTNSQNALVTQGRPYGFNGTTWDRQKNILGAIGAAGVGVQAVETNGALFANITTATTTTPKSAAGILHNLTINTFIASATITIYNNTAASGAKIATLTLPSTITSLAPLVLNFDLEFSTGLTIVTSAATDLTVTYR
jgi:hypothetical protein